MTYVATEACIRCKCTDCVDVCPTDAFRGLAREPEPRAGRDAARRRGAGMRDQNRIGRSYRVGVSALNW